MDESSALDVTAARAVEMGDRERTLWSDADREWASRAAAEEVGEGAAGETFLARRARLVLERVGARHALVTRTVSALRWRPWLGMAIVAGAFVVGVAVDRIGGAHRINLLAPPVLALLLWNVVAYVALLAGLVIRRRSPGWTGPLRTAFSRIAGLRVGGVKDGAAGGIRAALAAIPRDWARLAAPLYAARAARVLHLAAAAVALGVIAGMYTRGLALEYRASWQSTFLSASEVRALLAFALAPGSLLTGVAVPGVAALEAIRAPASQNAASWLHLLAGSIAVVVVIPRLLLAFGTALVERHRATHMPVPLSDPYYRRLLRGFGGEPMTLRVIPYSYAAPPAAIAGLELLAARTFGGGATLALDEPMAWGDDEAIGRWSPDGRSVLIALFNLTATPEPEAQGAFLDALVAGAAPARGRAANAAPTEPQVFAVVDESAFRARWPDEERRLAERRAAWDELFAGRPITALFIDLSAPDLAAAEATVEAALAHDAGRQAEAATR